jgi:hypothetical protein
MKNTGKGLVILGLLALCVILTAGVFMLGQSPRGEDGALNTGESAKDVTPGDISDSIADADAPAINPGGCVIPSEMPPGDSGDAGQSKGDIPLTTIPDKPAPPELPDTAHQGGEDDRRELPADPALTNPNAKPDSSPKPAETAPPNDTPPNAGDKNGAGEVYIPGFGWVKDEGGGGQGEKSVGEGSLEKIIGH